MARVLFTAINVGAILPANLAIPPKIAPNISIK
jgi:hypothetical protein